MRPTILAALVSIVAVSPGCAVRPMTQPHNALEHELIGQIQARLDAIAVGDKRPWQQDLDASALLMDEEGNVSTKAQFLAALEPLPKGSTGTLRVTQPHFSRVGDNAVVAFIADEHETIFRAHFAAKFGMMDTYRLEGSRWLLLADTQTRLPREPPTIALSAREMQRYVGRYHMESGDYVFVVAIKDGILVGGRQGSAPHALLAIADQANTFFQRHSPATLIFVPGPDGVPVRLIDRRYYNRDLTYIRMQ